MASSYTQKQVRELTEYALHRGVRVVVEIDTPGHTYSWGRAYPNIIANCSKYISSRSISYPQINSVSIAIIYFWFFADPLDRADPARLDKGRDLRSP